MKLKFIKTRGRPPKKIRLSPIDMDVLRMGGTIIITGYIVKNER